MPEQQVTQPTEEVLLAIEQFQVARDLGKIANRLEAEVRALRNTVDHLGLEPLHAPEGHAFRVMVEDHEGVLKIEPFDHQNGEWGTPNGYRSSEYESLVSRSGWGDDANINVDTLEYDSHQHKIWGYDSLRRVRVLVDHRVYVRMVQTKPKDNTDQQGWRLKDRELVDGNLGNPTSGYLDPDTLSLAIEAAAEEDDLADWVLEDDPTREDT